MDGYYRRATRYGTFSIRWQNERWHALFDGQSLGNYASARQALDDLCGGHTCWPSTGIDPSTCGLPDELADWEFVRLR